MELSACRKIWDLAQSLRPAYAEYERILDMAVDAGLPERLAAAMNRYNDAVTKILPLIAQLTPNSESTLRQVFMPEGDISKLTPDFLERVAQYQSFNDRLWTQYSGMEQAPTYSIEQLRSEGSTPAAPAFE